MRRRRYDPVGPFSWRNALAYGFCAGLAHNVMRLLFRVRHCDTWPLPEGPVILAPNHCSFVDPLVVGPFVTRRVVFMMYAKYYDNPVFHWVYRAARCIPVDVGSESRRALREGKRVLDAGKPLVIFPEGRISPDGALQPAQPGLAWLARMTGAPVVPMHIGGSRDVLTKGSWKVRFKPMTLRQGRPRRRAEFPPGRRGDEAFSDAVMADIAALDPARDATGGSTG